MVFSEMVRFFFFGTLSSCGSISFSLSVMTAFEHTRDLLRVWAPWLEGPAVVIAVDIEDDGMTRDDG